jgi:ATP-binding cassette subfamily C (CFTR/MRP) protein 1
MFEVADSFQSSESTCSAYARLEQAGQSCFFEPLRVDLPLMHFLQLVLSVLLALKAIFVAFRTRQTKLRTSFVAPAGGLDIVATFVTIVLTHLEDERSIAPSTVLVLYYSASSLCFLPILRTTWLLEDNVVCSLIWTFIWLLTLVILVLESSTKRSWTTQKDRDIRKEQLASFWGRSFFIHLLPFLWFGYSNTIGISDIPAVDKPLRSKEAYGQLLPNLRRYKGRFRLLRAILSAFKWSLASAIVPRLSLTGLSFCQAFLMSATLRLVKDQKENIMPSYRGGIIGAYVLVYFGLAVSDCDKCSRMSIDSYIGLAFDIPPSSISFCHHYSCLSCVPRVRSRSRSRRRS